MLPLVMLMVIFELVTSARVQPQGTKSASSVIASQAPVKALLNAFRSEFLEFLASLKRSVQADSRAMFWPRPTGKHMLVSLGC